VKHLATSLLRLGVWILALATACSASPQRAAPACGSPSACTQRQSCVPVSRNPDSFVFGCAPICSPTSACPDGQTCVDVTFQMCSGFEAECGCVGNPPIGQPCALGGPACETACVGATGQPCAYTDSLCTCAIPNGSACTNQRGTCVPPDACLNAADAPCLAADTTCACRAATGQACSSTAGCLTGDVCQNELCIHATTADCSPPCAFGSTCKNGECVAPTGGDCRDRSYCVDGDECVDVHDNPNCATAPCTCVSAIANGEACTTQPGAAPCTLPDTCVDPSGGGAGLTCAAGDTHCVCQTGSCRSSADCTQGRFCVDATDYSVVCGGGECTCVPPLPVGRPCTTDMGAAPCAAPGECINSFGSDQCGGPYECVCTVPPGGACRTSSDCTRGNACVDASDATECSTFGATCTCVGPIGSGQPCTTQMGASPCASSGMCVDTTGSSANCAVPGNCACLGPSGQGCSTQRQCPAGASCVDALDAPACAPPVKTCSCVAAVAAGEPCTTQGSPCAAPGACVDATGASGDCSTPGRCTCIVPTGGPCTSPTQCPSGEFCVDDLGVGPNTCTSPGTKCTCIPSIPAGGACVTGADSAPCAAQYACLDDIGATTSCVHEYACTCTLPRPSTCATSADCAGGQSCVDGADATLCPTGGGTCGCVATIPTGGLCTTQTGAAPCAGTDLCLDFQQLAIDCDQPRNCTCIAANGGACTRSDECPTGALCLNSSNHEDGCAEGGVTCTCVQTIPDKDQCSPGPNAVPCRLATDTCMPSAGKVAAYNCCDNAYTNCDGRCTTLGSNIDCGACDNACAAGQTCHCPGTGSPQCSCQ
jgi:hypothetical protein